MILLQGSDVGCTPATHPRHVIEAASLKFQAGLHLCRQSITGSQDKLSWAGELKLIPVRTQTRMKTNTNTNHVYNTRHEIISDGARLCSPRLKIVSVQGWSPRPSCCCRRFAPVPYGVIMHAQRSAVPLNFKHACFIALRIPHHVASERVCVNRLCRELYNRLARAGGQHAYIFSYFNSLSSPWNSRKIAAATSTPSCISDAVSFASTA